MQYYASHEYAEAVTDPQPYKGWWATVLDSNGKAQQEEIGDLCDTGGNTYSPVDHTYIQPPASPPPPQPQLWVTSLWDNSTQHCQWTLGQEYLSPDHTSPFQGKHTVQGSILSMYQSYGAGTGTLGQPVTEQMPTVDTTFVSYFAGGGCGNGGVYGEHSAIFDYAGNGNAPANAIYGCIYQHFIGVDPETNQLYITELGVPTSSETDAPGGGRVNYFYGSSAYSWCGYTGPYSSHAAIYWTGSAAYAVKGCLYDYYQHTAGGPTGSMGLGLPASEEEPLNGGTVEYFAGSGCTAPNQGSAIYDNDGTGIHAVKGCLYYYYNHNYNGTAGLGFPTSDELSMGGGHGQHFSIGAGIYDGPGTGIYMVHGTIWGKYSSLGEANSFLGFPTYDETAVSTGRVSYFGGTSWGSNCGSAGPYNSHAAIYWTPSTGAHEVHGCMYNVYVNSYAGPNSFLGFPTGDQVDLSGGGHTQNFQNGYINFDANGNVTVRAYCPQFC